MAANGANSQLRSEIRIPQRDGMTSTPSPMESPVGEPDQIIPLQQRPLQGPPQPTETPDDATSTTAFVENLLRTARFNDRRR